MDWLSVALLEKWDYSNVVAAYLDLSYPIRFFDKHAVRATGADLTSPSRLLVSTNRLLGVDPRKIAALARFRLISTPLGQQALGQTFDELISRNYLLWTSDLYLLPGPEMHYH